MLLDNAVYAEESTNIWTGPLSVTYNSGGMAFVVSFFALLPEPDLYIVAPTLDPAMLFQAVAFSDPSLQMQIRFQADSRLRSNL